MALFLTTYFRLIFLTCLGAVLVTGCASVQTPGGGPKDTTPPKVIKEIPGNLTKNFKAQLIQIEFDEFIKLSNEFKEISISPALNRMPTFRVKKNVLEIKFQDTLEKNTTYTINFGKAIIDYNAGNILKNYTYVFSTGNVIDSLSISGKVIQTLTKKPESDISVFIIPVSQDSIFGKKSASIFTTTDSAGNFSIRNIKPDTYRIYALKEQGGDRIYNSTNEEIGFLANPITLTKNISGITVETFKGNPAVFSTEDRKIENDGRIFLKFNQPVSEPSIKILSPPELDNTKTFEFSAKGDTALVWLPEITFDSLTLAIQSKGVNVDTVTFHRNKRDNYTRTLTIKDNINSGISPLNDLDLTFSSPVNRFDASKIVLKDDTVTLKGVQVIKDTQSPRKYKLRYPWKSGHTYTAMLAENAFTGPFGGNKIYQSRFRAQGADIYGDLILTITVPVTANYIIQLIKDEKDIIKSNPISASQKIEYHNIPIGKYNVRIIYDENKNGQWDTGNVKRGIQPEKVWNYPPTINLKYNWEQVETVIIPAAP
jgi:uncharacterized protein (DUF2141 family)